MKLTRYIPKLKFRFIHTLTIVAVGLMVMTLASCDSTTPEIKYLDQPDDDTPVQRSVLVYMLADNSLGRDGYDRQNLADMIAAVRDGRTGGNRLIIYHDDRNADHPALKEVTPMGLRIIKEYDDTESSVSGSRMAQVIADFKAIAPAENYGLILWSHATGWLQTGIPDSYQNVTPAWIGQDKNDYMNVTTLARVLDGKGFDYIYFDCCHMSSVESLYELRGVADTFVGSCTELPAEGMPYYETLPYLMAEDADLIAAARATFNKYDNLTGSARTSTMSVINASALDGLADATRKLYALHPKLSASYAGQSFERAKAGGEPCYMFDFADYIGALYSSDASDSNFRRAYAEWLIALDECVEYQAATPYIFNTIRISAHCGLSTYILRRESDADTKGYKQLVWWRDVASALYAEDVQTDNTPAE